MRRILRQGWRNVQVIERSGEHRAGDQPEKQPCRGPCKRGILPYAKRCQRPVYPKGYRASHQYRQLVATKSVSVLTHEGPCKHRRGQAHIHAKASLANGQRQAVDVKGPFR